MTSEGTAITEGAVSFGMGDRAVKMVEAAWARVPRSLLLRSNLTLDFIVLRDGAAALDAGAAISATVGIRAAVESAVYNFLIRVPFGGGLRIARRKARGRTRGKAFKEIPAKVAEDGALSPNLRSALARARKHGNHVAHFAEKMDARLLRRYSANRTRLRKRLPPSGRRHWQTPPRWQVFAELKEGFGIGMALADRKAAEALPSE